MGQDYSIVLCFEKNDVWNVLNTIADKSKSYENQNVELIIESGDRLKLPFTSHLKSGYIES